MAEPPDDWPPRGDTPLPQGPRQDAVEAFLRSPWPAAEPAAAPAEPWVPEATDVEEPTVIDVVLPNDPWLNFFRPRDDSTNPQDEGSYVVVELEDGKRATCWAFGPSTAEHPHLPEWITECLVAGDHVRLTGRWAQVRFDPAADGDGYLGPGRMFVIDGFELLDQPDRAYAWP
jgi:hypothetical protein